MRREIKIGQSMTMSQRRRDLAAIPNFLAKKIPFQKACTGSRSLLWRPRERFCAPVGERQRAGHRAGFTTAWDEAPSQLLLELKTFPVELLRPADAYSAPENASQLQQAA